MQTLSVTTYEFDELSDSAKAKARDWYREASSCDTYWSEYTIGEAVEQGQLLGIEFATRPVQLHGGGTRQEPKIYWSGFSCQGDGACFEGTWRAKDVKADSVADGWGDAPETTKIKRIAEILAEVAAKFPCGRFTTTHNDRYYHENSVDFDFDSGADDCSPDQLNAYRTPEDDAEDPDEMPRQRMAEDFPEDCLKEAARDFMRWIYKQLEKAWEYENSDENVDESIRANDYQFTESGRRSVSL
jgi:hypothetical protein